MSATRPPFDPEDYFWFLTDGKINVPHTLRAVPVGSLHIDRAVQRSKTNPAKVEEMKDTWDDAHAGVIKVSRRPDGELCVIDGFHRVMAKSEADGPESVLMAQVFDIAASPEWNPDKFGIEHIHAVEQAIFTMTDSTAKIHPADKLKIRINGHEPEAMEIAEILDVYGLSVGQSGDSKRVIRAAGALTAAYTNQGKTALTRALDTLVQVYGYTAKTWQGPHIEGLAIFYDLYPHVDGRDVVKSVKKYHPANGSNGDLATHARRRIENSGARITRAREVAKVVREDHDNKLSKNSRKRLSRDPLDDD